MKYLSNLNFCSKSIIKSGNAKQSVKTDLKNPLQINKPNPSVFASAFLLILLQASITGKLDCSIPIPAHFVNAFYFLMCFWSLGSSLILFTVHLAHNFRKGWLFAATQLTNKVKSWTFLAEHSESSQDYIQLCECRKQTSTDSNPGEKTPVWMSCNSLIST